MDESRIATAIEAYDAEGWHRTGTDVDAASARALAGNLAAAGLQPTLEPYGLRRVVPHTATVDAGDHSAEGLPLFDSLLAPSLDIKGTLGTLGSDAEIGLAILDGPGDIEAFQHARRQDQHKALIAVTVGPKPGLVARNADSFNAPFGPPTLMVGSEERGWLEATAEDGGTVHLVLNNDFVQAESANVVAKVSGSNPSLPPIVVTTPRSGWFHCASERGGGLTIWLEVARDIAASPLQRDVLFVAFSGHELGHLGLNAFLEHNGSLVTGAEAWVHFGANLGASTSTTTRVGASRTKDRDAARQQLAAAGLPDIESSPDGTVVGLEPQTLHRLGGRCIAVVGGNDYFHLVTDRWPYAVDVGRVATIGRGFLALIRQLGDSE